MIKRLGLDKYSALYLWGFFIVLFSIWAPDTFPTWTSAKTVLNTPPTAPVLTWDPPTPLASRGPSPAAPVCSGLWQLMSSLLVAAAGAGAGVHAAQYSG